MLEDSGRTIDVWQEVVSEPVPVIYTVEEKDMLADILRKFDISIPGLREHNKECDLFTLRKGQRIRIQNNRPRGKNAYQLKEGEDLFAIAGKYNKSILSFLKANAHLRPSEFKKGVWIELPE